MYTSERSIRTLAYLLVGPGETRQIGPERGRPLHDGIAVFKSTATKGSSRYVLYEDGRAVAALQTVVLSPSAPARIANVYVVPHRRRAGLATALLKRARKDGPVEHADEDQISDAGKAWRDVVGNARQKPPERARYDRVPPFLTDGGAALEWARENIADFDADDSTAEDAAYTYADFAGAAFRVGALTVYRAISVPVQKNGALGIRFGCLGTSWSKNRSGADVYNPVPHSGELKKVVLTGEVAPEDVDWEYALTSFMLYGEDQWEVSLLPNVSVTVTHIDEAPLEPAVEGNTGPTIEQWRDCPPKKVKKVESNAKKRSPAQVDPLGGQVMYHGTTAKFSEFDAAHMSPSGAYGAGFYFSNDYDLGKEYSDGGEPVAARLSLRNPWVVDLDLPYDDARRREAQQVFRGKGVRERLQAEGYDGVLVKQGDYLEAIVYEPSQIKRIDPTPNARSTEGDLPRTSAIFDALFDQLAADFDDFGEIELHCDEAAGSDNGHGSDRQFGYCSTEAPWRIAFAAKIETLPDEYISGLVRHELGHALDHRYGRKALEKRFGKKLPDSVERRADKVAEYAFGEPIEYGDLDVQCVGCEGKPGRPKRLG